MTTSTPVAAIAIGRNEGARLDACLASLSAQAGPVVYVDSGSTDDSLEIAKRHGAEIVSLDMSRPFTAARARNAGFEHLLSVAGDHLPDYIQFVDGDCALQPDWIDTATAFLDAHGDVAIVCGRRRERYPDATIFNRLCDIEWATPIGDAKACGGDFLVRTGAFKDVNGFNPALIAGEEPDLCFRLREKGWKIWRLDAEMTLHDAAMTRVGQWWSRAKRAGYAFANGSALHGRSPERYWMRETHRAILFGGLFPLAVIAGAVIIHPLLLALLLYYPLQVLRVYRSSGHITDTGGRAAWAISCVASRFPEFQGVVKFHRDRRSGRTAHLIEYK